MRMHERMHELLAINRAIAGSLDYEELLGLVVDKTAELCPAERCVLLLADASSEARVAAHRGLDDEQAAQFSAAMDERIHEALREKLGFDENEKFLAVPVIRRGAVTGMLAVQRRSPATDDDEAESLLGALADQAAIALDHASRYRALLEQSRAAREELEVAARRKDEFLAMLAHELRNPLATITAALDVMQSFLTDDPRLARVAQGAQRQSRQMARLLDDLLDVSRVTRGKIELRWDTAVVQDIVDQAAQSVELSLQERRHSLRIDLPTDPVVVDCDAARLVQVIANLLSNSIKYTEPGGNISLTARGRDGQLEIRVRDDGIGISREMLPYVFDLFVQSEKDLAREQGGLGIGLTLVERLVRMHEGSIEAFSEGPGRGSEFVVRIPMTPARGSGDHRPESRAKRQGDRSARRVLIVDDNSDLASTIAAWLELEGHDVEVAHDGKAALDLARRRPPDVILLDLGLPDTDGHELARSLRTQSSMRPLLIAVTGYGSHEDRARAREAGINHHVVKPVDLQRLARLMSSCVT